MHGYKKGDTSTVDTVGLFITWTRPQMYFLEYKPTMSWSPS